MKYYLTKTGTHLDVWQEDGNDSLFALYVQCLNGKCLYSTGERVKYLDISSWIVYESNDLEDLIEAASMFAL